jgi:2-methylcitrate dehydratase PrpD
LHSNEKKIINFLDGFSLGGLPPAVLNEARRAVLDTLGCMIAGIDTPLGESLHELAGRFTDKHGVKVLGLEPSIIPFMAAMCNSYMANAHDADDGHRRSRLHAGGIIIPTALVAGEENGSTGKAFFESVITGYELGHRAGMATTALDTYYGSAMGSTFGAAAAAGRLMGLSAEQIVNAMGIAEMQAPNSMLMGWIEARKVPMVKEGMGWSAASGLMSAYMAHAGITGTLTIFNGREEISEIEKLGEEYEIQRRYYKPHPGCRWTQVPLQILQALMAEHGISAQDVREIIVRTLSNASNLDNPTPRTMEDAQYSIPFVLAAILVDGEFGPDQMRTEKLTDPEILAIAKRVKIEPEPEFDKSFPRLIQCEVRVTTQNGRTFFASNQKVKGDEDFPLSDEEIKNKFVWLSRNRLNQKQAQAVINDVWSLESHTNVSDFMASIHTITK